MTTDLPFQAIIFDMDETLVASLQSWTHAETRLFKLLGAEYTAEIAQRYAGMNAQDVARTIYRETRPAQYTEEDCARLMREYLLEGFRGPLHAMPGADALIRGLAGRLPLAVASGSPLEGIALAFRQFGWSRFFSVIVSSEEVAHGKPSPDVFLEAGRRLGCPPTSTLVIEDSLHGVHAAKAAGMTCYVVPSRDDPRIAEAADRAFTSLDGITNILLKGDAHA